MHTCDNCRFYEPGAYHDCKEAVEEAVVDKGRENFCESFSLAEGTGESKRNPKQDDARAKAEALFNL